MASFHHHMWTKLASKTIRGEKQRVWLPTFCNTIPPSFIPSSHIWHLTPSFNFLQSSLILPLFSRAHHTASHWVWPSPPPLLCLTQSSPRPPNSYTVDANLPTPPSDLQSFGTTRSLGKTNSFCYLDTRLIGRSDAPWNRIVGLRPSPIRNTWTDRNPLTRPPRSCPTRPHRRNRVKVRRATSPPQGGFPCCRGLRLKVIRATTDWFPPPATSPRHQPVPVTRSFIVPRAPTNTRSSKFHRASPCCRFELYGYPGISPPSPSPSPSPLSPLPPLSLSNPSSLSTTWV
jgi:hypothetical protein